MKTTARESFQSVDDLMGKLVYCELRYRINLRPTLYYAKFANSTGNGLRVEVFFVLGIVSVYARIYAATIQLEKCFELLRNFTREMLLVVVLL